MEPRRPLYLWSVTHSRKAGLVDRHALVDGDVDANGVGEHQLVPLYLHAAVFLDQSAVLQPEPKWMFLVFSDQSVVLQPEPKWNVFNVFLYKSAVLQPEPK